MNRLITCYCLALVIALVNFIIGAVESTAKFDAQSTSQVATTAAPNEARTMMTPRKETQLEALLTHKIAVALTYKYNELLKPTIEDANYLSLVNSIKPTLRDIVKTVYCTPLTNLTMQCSITYYGAMNRPEDKNVTIEAKESDLFPAAFYFGYDVAVDYGNDNKLQPAYTDSQWESISGIRTDLNVKALPIDMAINRLIKTIDLAVKKATGNDFAGLQNQATYQPH